MPESGGSRAYQSEAAEITPAALGGYNLPGAHGIASGGDCCGVISACAIRCTIDVASCAIDVMSLFGTPHMSANRTSAFMRYRTWLHLPWHGGEHSARRADQDLFFRYGESYLIY